MNGGFPFAYVVIECTNANYLYSQTVEGVIYVRDDIEKVIRALDADDLIDLVRMLNGYTNGVFDECVVYDMNDIDYIIQDRHASEVLERVRGQMFDIRDPYFRFVNNDGQIESMDEPSTVSITYEYMDEIVDNIIDQAVGKDFRNDLPPALHDVVMAYMNEDE